MKQRVKVTQKKEEKKEPAQCNHFWVIEVANGPSSIGTCRNCGETKEFFNAFPTFNTLKKGHNPFNLPRLAEVKIDKDSKS
jgi:hypothetical protein